MRFFNVIMNSSIHLQDWHKDVANSQQKEKLCSMWKPFTDGSLLCEVVGFLSPGDRVQSSIRTP